MTQTATATLIPRNSTKHGGLPADEERRLGYLVRDGDRDERGRLIDPAAREARDALIVANLALCLHVMRRYARKGVEFDDLIGIGNKALVKAAEKWDPDQGSRFVTYAATCIRRAILDYMCDFRTPIRVPRYIRTIEGHVAVAKKHGESFPVTPHAREFLEKSARAGRVRSLDTTPAAGSWDSWGSVAGYNPAWDGPTPDEAIERDDDIALLRARLQRLPAGERQALSLLYGLGGDEPMSLTQTGKAMGGRSKNWAKRTVERALRRLRDLCGEKEAS